jgi:Spy/CpxP family protein refolding chaperone
MKQGWKRAVWTLATLLAVSGGARAQEADVLLAPPPGAPAGPGPGFVISPGPGFGLMGGASMLRLPALQTELKLTGAQKQKLEEFFRQLREGQREFFQHLGGLTPEELGKRVAERRAAEEKQVDALLTPEQQQRYRQIQRQQQGLAALLEPSVAAELKLTEPQRGTIQAALREQDQAMRSLFQAGPGGFDPVAMRQKVEAAQKSRDARVMGALTEEQRRQWRALLGPPCSFPAAGPLLLPPSGPAGSEESPLPAEPSGVILLPE